MPVFFEKKFRGKYRVPSARLKDFDYSSNGVYYVTICTYNRFDYFGRIVNQRMELSEEGKMARAMWRIIPNIFPFVKLDEFNVMPDHIHGIIIIDKRRDAMGNGRDAINRVSTMPDMTGRGGITKRKNPMLNKYSLSRIIRWFKGRTKFEINKLSPINNFLWQERFYEHIIRNDEELDKIRKYIKYNALHHSSKKQAYPL